MKVAVAMVDELSEGGSLCRVVKSRSIALFLHQGIYYALEDRCPHAGAPLSGGPIEEGIITCPWHYWRFRLADGVGADLPRAKVPTFAVTIEGAEIFIELPEEV